MQPTKFTRGTNPGTRYCYCCKRRVWSSRFEHGGTELCTTCFDSASYENEHLDAGHEPGGNMTDCPMCNNVSCLHALPNRV